MQRLVLKLKKIKRGEPLIATANVDVTAENSRSNREDLGSLTLQLPATSYLSDSEHVIRNRYNSYAHVAS